MTKITLSNVADLTNSTTAQATINSNSATVQSAFDNTLSRDGTSPNTMGAVLDMNSFNIINLPTPISGSSPARLVDIVSNPTLVLTIPTVGTSGSTVPLLNGINTWSAIQTFSSRTVISYVPVFDLAAGAFSTTISLINLTVTVPASATYSALRFGDLSGTTPTYTVGSGGTASDIYSSPTSSDSSNSSSNTYGAIIQATNAGPGTVKGIHGGVFATGTSTGAIIAMNLQMQPVATSGYTSGGFAALTSSGVNNKAIGYGVESNGDQYLFAMGNSISALPIGTDFIRWWQHSSSAAGANFLNLLASDGTTTNFKVTKAGAVTAATYTSPGFTVDGSGNVTGLIYTGTSVTTTGAHTAFSGTAVPAGGTTGSGFKISSTANLGVFFGSGVPTLSAAQGSLYIRTDGSSTSTRMYINTTGSTTWTNVTTAA